MSFFDYIEHGVFASVIAVLVSIYFRNGPRELSRVLVVILKQLPGVDFVIGKVLQNEVKSFLSTTKLNEGKKKEKKGSEVQLPQKGVPHAELLETMQKMKKQETNSDEGKIFAYIYTLSDDHFQLQREAFDLFSEKIGHSVDHDALVKEFHHGFLHENALNPMLFPSLRKMETEVVRMTASMLNGGDDALGFMTSGGTESNVMAVKTFRDRAQKLFPHITEPEIVAPRTIHPTIDKAAQYFGMKVVHTPLGPDFGADVKAMEKAIGPNTVMLAASAPQFCHGIMDPIEEIAALAHRRGLPLHIDACFGGYMLPWVEKLGYPVQKFDFRNPGVTSISADIHKYGYSIKGSSVIIYRNADIRKYQIFSYAEWPGGLYGSPSMAGTRPGGNIAAAWASMMALGVEGYMERAKVLMETTNKLKEGVNKIQGLYVLGKPVMTCFSIGSSDPDVDIQAVADAMGKKGWHMERQQNPSCLHCSILPHHVTVSDSLLKDLEDSTQEVKKNKALANEGTAAMYGMIATIPDKAIVKDFLVEFFSEVYK